MNKDPLQKRVSIQRISRRRRREASIQPEGIDPRVFVLGTIVFLCPFLGGSEARWSQAVILVILSVLLWISPPSEMLSRRLNWIFAALVLLAVVPFLPAACFFGSGWRGRLLSSGISLPVSLTPQPWFTLDGVVLLLGGLSWTYFLAVQRWTLQQHRQAFRTFAIAVLTIAVLSVVLYAMGRSLPFWHNQRNFGPFANRNNTSNLLALGGIALMACAHDDLQRSKMRALLWLSGVGVILTGLILNFSRSGIVMLFLGLAVWLAILAFQSADRIRIAIGTSIAIVLATCFLLAGGETAKRFEFGKNPASVLFRDSRWPLQRDVVRLVADSPWPGIGLGNFEDVFPPFRKASYSQGRALHPESDWMWLAVEMGWPAVLLVLAGCSIFMRQIKPLQSGTNSRLRAAAATGALVFLIHGLVNVSGHVIGTVFPALFLASLALNPYRERGPDPWTGPVFRTIAVILAIAGCTWLIAIAQNRPAAGLVGLSNLKRAAAQAYTKQQLNKVIALSEKGLTIAPLDWELFYLRGAATLFSTSNWQAARDDFRRARTLIPNSWQVAYREGLCWLMVRPTEAIEPWREALTRCRHDYSRLYSDMLEAAKDIPQIRENLRQLATGDIDRETVFMSRMSSPEFDAELGRFEKLHPGLSDLTSEHRGAILQLWTTKGRGETLIAALAEHSEWQDDGWRWIAMYHSGKKNYELAYQTAIRYVPSPALPVAKHVSKEGAIRIDRALVLNAADFASAYQLYKYQLEGGRVTDALTTVRKVTKQAGCPQYFHYLEANLWAETNQWEAAWQALQRYTPAIREKT